MPLTKISSKGSEENAVVVILRSGNKRREGRRNRLAYKAANMINETKYQDIWVPPNDNMKKFAKS